MKSLHQPVITLVACLSLIVITGCSNSSTDQPPREPQSEGPSFTANVTGATIAEVSGAGVVSYLPPKEHDIVTGDRPGYFLIANRNIDLTEERGVTITFRIPDEAQPGQYSLMPSDPLQMGKNFDVEVERMEGGKLISYQNNTEGTLTLVDFSPDRTFPEISHIKGQFQFVTESNEGEKISAHGDVEFPLEKQVVFLNTPSFFGEFPKT
jgi:hypothetical protein